MQTLFQHYSLQPKPEYSWNVFDTNICSKYVFSIMLLITNNDRSDQ